MYVNTKTRFDSNTVVLIKHADLIKNPAATRRPTHDYHHPRTNKITIGTLTMVCSEYPSSRMCFSQNKSYPYYRGPRVYQVGCCLHCHVVDVQEAPLASDAHGRIAFAVDDHRVRMYVTRPCLTLKLLRASMSGRNLETTADTASARTT